MPKQGAELETEAVQRTIQRLKSIVCSSARDISLRLVHPKPQGLSAGAGAGLHYASNAAINI